jgi:general secretion pathway protein J
MGRAAVPSRQPDGFTLLELLAVLAVFGMLLLALGQGMQFGLQAWRIQARAMTWPDDAEALDRALRRLVGGALAPDEVEGRGPLIGEPAVLDVVTRLSGPAGGPPAPTGARLEVDGAHRLVLRLLPRPHVRWQMPPRPAVVVLAERIERIEFAYWKAAPGGGGAWQRAWPGPDMPALVRMRLVFPPGDARRWPDIVAGPALGGLAS